MVTEFENPLTGTCYRLRLESTDTWRISKVIHVHGNAVLRHLRGTTTPGATPTSDIVDGLVRGNRHAGPPVRADPHLTFAEVILVDLDRSASVLTAEARNARHRTLTGSPGFRPGCPSLRTQEWQALAVAVAGCQALARAWRASRLGSPGYGLPDWLAGALADLAAELDPTRPMD